MCLCGFQIFAFSSFYTNVFGFLGCSNESQSQRKYHCYACDKNFLVFMLFNYIFA